MAVVIASNLRKELAGSLLFDGVSFKVERGERLALSGPNGAGKTTLLRILAGQTELHGGELAFSKGTRIALHDQRPPLHLDLTLRDYVLGGAADLVALEQELRRLEEAMAGGAHDDATMRRYSEAVARLEHAGGWDWRTRTAAVVRGLGFSDDDLDRALTTFSGGELTRASLGRALAGDPDLLLLDEPTNHLDVANLEWLETTLTTLDAGVILVAHDRWFLEAVTTAVLELERGRALYFAGPWHEWRREKASRALAAGKAVQRYDADIARLERFVERFRYKKSKAKQAQAKLTQIGRLSKERAKTSAELDALTLRGRSLGFEFLDPPRSGKTVVDVSGLDVSAGTKRLLTGATVAIDRAEHVALVGPNGSGKTTLLETLLGRQLGYGVVPAYFSQQETELDERGTVLDCVQSMTGLTRPNAQNLLGRFLFSGWEEHQKAVLGTVRRRAASPRARGRRRLGRELPRPRRADEPPRPGEPRGARGRAACLPRDRPARLARPRAPRRGRRTDPGDRGPAPGELRGRLGRLRAPPRRAGRGRTGRVGGSDPGTCPEGTAAEKDSTSEAEAAAAARARSSSRPRSRRRSRPSPTSSGASPTTGRTSTRSPPTAGHARSWRRSSRAGRRLVESAQA